MAFTIAAVLIVYAILRDESDDSDPTVDPALSSPTSMTKTSTDDPTAEVSAQATSKTRSTTPSQPSGSKVITWIDQYGPAGGATSVTEALFASLSDGLCQEALDEVNGDTARAALDKTQVAIYRGAALACLAAFNDRPQLWAEAESASAAVAGGEPLANCLDSAVYQLWHRLIDAHRAEPSAQLVRGSRGNAAQAHCARILSLIPAHGPASGGYQIKIVGEYLPNPAVIHFGGNTTTVATNNNQAIITVPPASPGESMANVWEDGWPYGPPGSPEFSYDQEPTTTPESIPPSSNGP